MAFFESSSGHHFFRLTIRKNWTFFKFESAVAAGTLMLRMPSAISVRLAPAATRGSNNGHQSQKFWYLRLGRNRSDGLILA
jgi:hypothetical protein